MINLAWIKALVGTEGNEQADQAAKKGAAGGSHMKETQTPIPWQVAKSKIEEYTTSKWKHKWITAPQYKHTKLFYDSPNKKKSKYILKMGTYMLSTWIKSITGHNISNLSSMQRMTPHTDYACKLMKPFTM